MEGQSKHSGHIYFTRLISEGETSECKRTSPHKGKSIWRLKLLFKMC